MATVMAPRTHTHLSAVDLIGLTAGDVWHLLDEHGPQSIARVVKQVNAPRDLVMQAIGWLAREEKITIQDGPRGRVLVLRA